MRISTAFTAMLLTLVAGSAASDRALASGWSIQATPNPTGVSASALEGVSCSAATACIGVGDINGISGPAGPLAEQWDGTAWSTQPNPPGQYLTGVSCTSTAACTAVGDYRVCQLGQCRPFYVHVLTLAERWNGSGWLIQPTPNPSTFDNVLDGVSCSSATACTAVGSGVNAPLAERWNGAGWSIQPTPKPAGTQPVSLFSVSCPTAAECTAVGDYESSATGYIPLAEEWNGAAWSIQPIPIPSNGVLEHVSCPAVSACIAVGWDSAGALIEQWNGTTWSIQPTPAVSGATHSVLSGVSCPTETACSAVGAYTNSLGTQVALAESYSG